jgi:branched-chain amino acid transport system substrate-binding protein
MPRLSFGSICLAALIAAALAQAAPAESIKIGVFGPLTGDAAAMGSSEKEAVELAVKEKNDAGGSAARKSRPSTAMTPANRKRRSTSPSG